MSGRPLSSKEGYEKYLNIDTKLQLKYDKSQSVLYRKDLNPRNSIWYMVEYNNELIKIHYSELLKPGREHFIRVKPQNVGLTGHYHTPYDVADTVYNSLDNVDEYNRLHIIKLLCKFNSRFANKHHNKYKNIKLETYQNSENNLTIAKDFGEVLGVLWLNENDIEFPKEYNFPLYDYTVNNIRYSAKTSKSCNTVKLSHIKELIPDHKQSHWLSRFIYKYKEYIDESNIANGNQLFEVHHKQYHPSELSGGRYWREFSNQQVDDITSYYLDVVNTKIKNIITYPKNGDFSIELKSPRIAKIKLKEYREQLGIELFF